MEHRPLRKECSIGTRCDTRQLWVEQTDRGTIIAHVMPLKPCLPVTYFHKLHALRLLRPQLIYHHASRIAYSNKQYSHSSMLNMLTPSISTLAVTSNKKISHSHKATRD